MGSSDKLLSDIKQAGRDKDAGKPGADARLSRLLEKLRKRGPYGLNKPLPERVHNELD